MRYIPTFQGKKHSEEAKKKTSKALQGRKFTEEHRKNLSESMKKSKKNKKQLKILREKNIGKKHTEEHKRKISESLKGRPSPMKGRTPWNKGKKTKSLSDEHKKKISESLKGRKWSEEEIEKHRKITFGKNNPMYGKEPWNKGLTKEIDPRVKRTSEKLKGRKCTWGEKISKARIGKYVGENHPNWQGGLKDNPYGIEFNEKLRERIRKRDGRECVLCGGRDEDRKLQVHHIDYDKTNNNPENLVSLCLSCHVKTNYDREQWKKLFQTFIQENKL